MQYLFWSLGEKNVVEKLRDGGWWPANDRIYDRFPGGNNCVFPNGENIAVVDWEVVIVSFQLDGKVNKL